MDWFNIGEEVWQGYILSPCLFSFYAEYIMRNARLDGIQAGISTARRNINNLRYAEDINLMGESEKELKTLLMKVKEESEKGGFKTQNSKKLRSWNPVPSLYSKWKGKKWKIFSSWALKPLWMVAAAMKSGDVCFSAGKL